MFKSSTLSKTILDKLTLREQQKLKKMENDDFVMGEKMLKAQLTYTKYVRKSGDHTSAIARRLADKGFKYESLAFNSSNELSKYKEQLKKKYSKK